MANLAAAMMNYIREASNHTVSGQLGITETYVRVLWLCITLVIAGALFLITYGYYEDKKARRRCWKDSELALLFHELRDGNKRLARLNTISEMEYVASRMKVRMTSTRTGGQALRLTG